MKYTVLALLCLLPALLFAQAFQWTTFTSTSNVVDMVVSQGKVWTATSGGLAGYDPVSGTFDLYTNTRGLAMNECVAVGTDARGFVWAGLGDARITRINPTTHDVRQVVDLANDVFEINAILPVGDEVFVAANNGIYRFAYYRVVDDYRVLEAIKVLGTFPGETRVTSLAVSGGYLYAGTASGLARVSLSLPQLNAPAAWTTFTHENSSLPENNVVALQGYADPANLLNIATPNYVSSLVDTVWTTQLLPGVVDFADEDFHWAVSDTNGTSHVWHVDAPQGQWQATGDGLPSAIRVAVVRLSGVSMLVLGMSDSGQGSGGLILSASPGNTPWGAPVSAPGIGGNFITALGVDPQGKLWAGGSGSTSGVYVRHGDTWTNFDRSTGYQHPFFYAHPTSFAFDDFGGTWAGSTGNGVAWFHSDSITYFNNFDWDTAGFANVGGTLVPRLNGLNDSPTQGKYYVETYVARDAGGNVFISNLETKTGYSVMAASRGWMAHGNNPAPWPYFLPHGVSLQATTYYYAVGRMLADPYDRLWIGSGRNGGYTFVLDTRGTLADTTDDQWSAFTPNERRDNVTCFDPIDKEVLDWTVDHQGYMWAGSISGAYYTQGGVPGDPTLTHFICVADLPVGHRVNAIHVDAQDNKWFGTDNGVAVLDKNFNWIYVFQTANSVDHPSGLVSNNVLAITSNPETGEIWIGTADGLSRFTSAFVSSGSGDLGSLWPYPNPFHADGSQHMRVDPVRLGGRFDEFRVLTMSGRLVRKLDWAAMTDPGSTGGWDGRNDGGEFVAGGIYLLVASSNDGKSAVGKIAVLGR
ncbi:MAG TPA: hypothetical protein VGL38_10625 [bacterium]|jgi:hypothetical protein